MAVLKLLGDISGFCEISAANTAGSVSVTTPTQSGNLISIPYNSLISNGKIILGNTNTGNFKTGDILGGSGITISPTGDSITISATGLGATDQFARDQANGAFNKANSISTNLGSLNLSPSFAQISSNINQLPANTSAVVVNFDTNDALLDITHTTGNTRVIVSSNGLYHIMFSGRVSRGVGITQERADYWFRKNGTDIANSAVSVTLEDSDTTTVTSKYATQLVANDYIEVVQAVSNSSINMGLTRADSLAGGPSNPSITLTIIKVLSAQSAPAFGTATLDFGSAPGSTSANVNVTGQTQLSSNAHIQVYIQGNDQTTDHTAFEHGFIKGYINLFVQNVVGGTGFNIEAHSQIRLTGQLVVRWRYN